MHYVNRLWIALGICLSSYYGRIHCTNYWGICFRGFLLQRFAAKWGTSIAIIVVAILFALLHVDFLGAIVFSVVLSIVYIRTNSLLMPIAIHMLNNAFVIGASF